MTRAAFSFVVRREDDVIIDVTLGHQAILHIARNVADHPSQMALLDLLAAHPSAEVRRSVSSHACLEEARVAALSTDPDLQVKNTVIQSPAFKRWASTDRILAMADGNVEVALHVASDVHVYDETDPNHLAGALAGHSDPAVRAALAEGWRTPKHMLKRLLNDADDDVRLAVHRKLRERE